MYKKKKNKYPPFVMGIIIGTIIGLIVGLYFSSLETKKQNNTPIPFFKNIDTLQNTDTSTIQEEKPLSLTNSKAIQNKALDTVKTDKNDSIRFISEIEISNIKENNIQVANNELIYSTYIIPSGDKSDFSCNTNDYRDSLLVNNPSNDKKDGISVEFWTSPINYTGYKLNSSKLILFGIYEYTNIQLEYLSSGILQMTYNNKKYNLSCSDDFKAIIIKKNKHENSL